MKDFICSFCPFDGESEAEYTNRIENMPLKHIGYAYFRSVNYNSSNCFFAVFPVWNGAINTRLEDPLPEGGFKIDATPDEAKELCKNYMGLKIYGSFNITGGMLRVKKLCIPALGKVFELIYNGCLTRIPENVYYCGTDNTSDDVIVSCAENTSYKAFGTYESFGETSYRAFGTYESFGETSYRAFGTYESFGETSYRAFGTYESFGETSYRAFGTYESFGETSYRAFGTYESFGETSYRAFGTYESFSETSYRAFGTYESFGETSYRAFGTYESFGETSYRAFGTYENFGETSYRAFGTYDNFDMTSYRSSGSYTSPVLEDVSAPCKSIDNTPMKRAEWEELMNQVYGIGRMGYGLNLI